MAVSWLCLCVLLSASLSACTTVVDIAVGLIESMDVLDEDVQHAARFASETASSDFELLEVTSAERKVVAGAYYYLSVTMGIKGDSQSTVKMNCNFEVYERPWENFISIEKSECTVP